ncbi:NTTRR-F1 domain [Paenibacillus alvei]|uniref:NTTRR-F1 domain n=1 Tax=Paenibacillus TaxID=44249 RepID=UPI003D301C8F
MCKKTNFYSAILAGGAVDASLSQVVFAAPGESYTLSLSTAKIGSLSSPQVNTFLYYYDATFSFLGTGLTTYLSAGTLPDAVNGTWQSLYYRPFSIDKAAQQVMTLPSLPCRDCGRASIIRPLLNLTLCI